MAVVLVPVDTAVEAVALKDTGDYMGALESQVEKMDLLVGDDPVGGTVEQQRGSRFARIMDRSLLLLIVGMDAWSSSLI